MFYRTSLPCVPAIIMMDVFFTGKTEESLCSLFSFELGDLFNKQKGYFEVGIYVASFDSNTSSPTSAHTSTPHLHLHPHTSTTTHLHPSHLPTCISYPPPLTHLHPTPPLPHLHPTPPLPHTSIPHLPTCISYPHTSTPHTPPPTHTSTHTPPPTHLSS